MTMLFYICFECVCVCVYVCVCVCVWEKEVNKQWWIYSKTLVSHYHSVLICLPKTLMSSLIIWQICLVYRYILTLIIKDARWKNLYLHVLYVVEYYVHYGWDGSWHVSGIPDRHQLVPLLVKVREMWKGHVKLKVYRIGINGGRNGNLKIYVTLLWTLDNILSPLSKFCYK